MKTIFRFANIGLFLAAIIVLGAVAAAAQDPCSEAEAPTQAALGDKFRELFPKRDLVNRKAAIDTGKTYLDKYGSCTPQRDQDLVDYLKGQIPKMEDAYAKAVAIDIENKLVAKFNTGLASKNWDDVYAAGKDLIANYGDKYREVEIALGSIGYDESYKGNFKYNEDTLRFARTSIADLESGKTFSPSYGVGVFAYKSKENALGWMNLTIGYITAVGKKDKPTALPFLYKATQANSETNKNPIPFEYIGYFYFEEGDKLAQEIQTMIQNQPADTAPPETIKAAVDAIKAKIALSNGVSERAIDAFSRAYTLGVAKAYKDKMHDNAEKAYNRRFGKKDGLDPWIADTVKKPFINPTTTVTPISDPEPVKSTTTTNTTPSTVKPPVTPVKTPAKPATTSPGKAPGTKGKVVVKKPAAKKQIV